MNIETCLRLANFAAKDSSLIKNHCDGQKGVDFYIKKHICDIDYILSLLSYNIEDEDHRNMLISDKNELEKALMVYIQ